MYELIGVNSTGSEVHALSIVRQPLRRLTGHVGAVMAVEWFNDGEQLITASWDRTANIYDAERGEIVNVLSGLFSFCLQVLKCFYFFVELSFVFQEFL